VKGVHEYRVLEKKKRFVLANFREKTVRTGEKSRPWVIWRERAIAVKFTVGVPRVEVC